MLGPSRFRPQMDRPAIGGVALRASVELGDTRESRALPRPILGFALSQALAEGVRRTTTIVGSLRSISLVVAVAVCGFAALAASADAANFTWSGAAAVKESKWSNGTNWGGTAPSGSVGTLSIPQLTSPACTAKPPTATCYTSENDISGLSVNALSLYLPEETPYFFFGKLITLGAGGLTATASANKHPGGDACVFLPIALGASQIWSVDGNSGFAELGVSEVNGESAALNISLSHKGELTTSCSSAHGFEVGTVTATGGDKAHTGMAAFENGNIALTGGSDLNGTDAKPVAITDASLSASSNSLAAETATIGPLTFTGGELIIGSAGTLGSLTVTGGVALDSKSGMVLEIKHPGTTPGVDYSQLNASGAVKLEGAELVLQVGESQCPTLNGGDVDTLVTAKGLLTGTFAGIANGATVPVLCSMGAEPMVQINYTEHAVTATALAAGPPPTVTKLAPTKGPAAGGTSVTITGTNFAGVTAVKFGSTSAASFKVNSASSITAVSPAEAAGKVDVTVTTSAGTSAVSAKDHFQFTPTVTKLSPTTGSKGGGTTVTVTGTGFGLGTAATSFAFGTTKGTSVNCTATTECTVVSPAHATGKVDVKATVNKVSSPKTSADQFTYV
jgi:hypothetical protein